MLYFVTPYGERVKLGYKVIRLQYPLIEKREKRKNPNINNNNNNNNNYK